MHSLAHRRRFLQWLGGAAALALLGSPRPLFAAPSRSRMTRQGRALGTDTTITVLHADLSVAERALDEAFTTLDAVESALSLYRPGSDLCRLNRDGCLPTPHPWLVEVLHAALDMAERTGGAFDPTVQPLWEVCAAAAKRQCKPDPAEQDAARRRVGWRSVSANPERVRLGDGQSVTLNGIAQGFALDQVSAVLRRHGIEHALLDTGEQGALGVKEASAPWTAGIQHPRVADAWLAIAAFDGRCLATSGDYATTFRDDFTAHHIFDPATGESPTELVSVTVAARTGMAADALSTAVFVLGAERGLRLVHDVPGADALLMTRTGQVLTTDHFPRLS